MTSAVRRSTGPQFYRHDALLVGMALAIAYLVVVSAKVGGVPEAVLGVAALFFLPGYAVASLLFGERSGLIPLGDLAVTVGFSVIFNGLVGLLLLALNQGLDSFWLAVGVAAVCVLAAGVGGFRVERPGASSIGAYIRRELTLADAPRSVRRVALVLVVAILVATGGLFYVASLHPTEVLTAQMLLAPASNDSSVPSSGAAGQVLAVQAEIVDGPPGGNLTLVVVATAGGSPAGGNVSLVGWNLPLHLSAGVESLDPLEVGPSGTSTVYVSFEFAIAGNYSIEFGLTSDGGGSLDTVTLPLAID